MNDVPRGSLRRKAQASETKIAIQVSLFTDAEDFSPLRKHPHFLFSMVSSSSIAAETSPFGLQHPYCMSSQSYHIPTNLRAFSNTKKSGDNKDRIQPCCTEVSRPSSLPCENKTGRRLNATPFPSLLWHHGGKLLNVTHSEWINKSWKINADVQEKSAHGHPAQWSLQRNVTYLSIKTAHWYLGHAFPSHHTQITSTSAPTRCGEPQRVAVSLSVPWTPHCDLLPEVWFARDTLWLLSSWPCSLLCFLFSLAQANRKTHWSNANLILPAKIRHN